VALMLSGIYESLGDTAESLRYYKYHHRVLEAINHEDIEKKVRNIKTILEAEQTQRENEVIKAQKLEIEAEKKRSDDLLLNILPPGIAEELKATGEAEARFYNNVSVLFTDFKGFTTVAERMTARELVAELHACFKAFDDIMERHGIEKIKTVGDAYLAVCGLPGPDAHHAVKMVAAACDIRDFMAARRQALGEATFAIRIGIHSGSVVAGIVGRKKFAFDIWGDTVNTAARMEQNSEAGRINISEATYGLVADRYTCTCRGEIAAKNKGSLRMYFVEA
jgi:class 3 adenylate cyclase